jgi:hypothetical protein
MCRLDDLKSALVLSSAFAATGTWTVPLLLQLVAGGRFVG